MSDDKLEIRQLADTWFAASQSGDFATVLDLMTDDVVFMVPGAKPFGKAAFAAAAEEMKDVSIDGATDIQEIEVLGEWAYIRNLEIIVTPVGGTPMRRAVNTLTILRKDTDGRWQVARDANLLAEVK